MYGREGAAMYRSEQALVNEFVMFLCSPHEPWGVWGYAREFDYTSGRTDVVAADEDGEVFAFEAKLKSWRQALAQAHRNRCFAHRSYVVLPAYTAYRALRFEPEFRRRGVGICLVSESGLVELIQSASESPCLDWLSKRALGVVEERREVGACR
jgi:GNAT superfamily N-acetyltransferase